MKEVKVTFPNGVVLYVKGHFRAPEFEIISPHRKALTKKQRQKVSTLLRDGFDWEPTWKTANGRT